MTRIRHMALWLVAAIVLIAVGGLPSDARAHAGHAHSPQSDAAAVPAALPQAAAVAARTGGREWALEGARERSMAPGAAGRPGFASADFAPAASPVRALTAGPCDGACCQAGCRGSGSCCTGAGLTPETADPALPRGPDGPALAGALPARTDVVPEALPEPPRFTA